MACEFGVNPDALRQSARQWLDLDTADSSKSAQALLEAQAHLRHTLQSPRIPLLMQFNDLPEGVKFLANMRAQLVKIKGDDSELRAFDREFRDLLTSWSDVGFLELRRITWHAKTWPGRS
ncbi:MAG: malonyl-CoA decarboxylase N-terminal domain-containing protein [Arenicellales bacterium]|nr:malonyl-CoA decarboxylase N-terminal domain-containing protein [Arenicellales bacterium]